MPTDGATAKFLYTILKQLDLKSIDWQTVATSLEITNGHAARMRFSRFKQAMEGVAPAPRRRTTTTPRPRKPKAGKPDSKSSSTCKKRGLDEISKADDDEPAATTRVKKEEPVEERGSGIGMQGIEGGVCMQGVESGPAGLGLGCGTAERLESMTLAPVEASMQASMIGDEMGTLSGVPYPAQDSSIVKKEPVVKVELVPGWDD